MLEQWDLKLEEIDEFVRKWHLIHSNCSSLLLFYIFQMNFLCFFPILWPFFLLFAYSNGENRDLGKNGPHSPGAEQFANQVQPSGRNKRLQREEEGQGIGPEHGRWPRQRADSGGNVNLRRDSSNWAQENFRPRLPLGNISNNFGQMPPPIWPKERRNWELPEATLASEQANICGGWHTGSPICRHFAHFGWPIEDPLISKGDFLISFNQRTRLANWVLERISPESVRHNPLVSRQEMDFYPEEQLNDKFRATESDYWAVSRAQLPFPMNRGHLAPALDHWTDQRAMHATFSLANIAPQSKSLNDGAWNWLEKRARQAVLNGNRNPPPPSQFQRQFSFNKAPNVFRLPGESKAICPGPCPGAFIYTGPLFLPQGENPSSLSYKTVGEHRLAVPSHFFKAILIQTPYGIQTEAFYLPNKPMDENTFLANYEKYKISLDKLGFDLVPGNEWINGSGAFLPQSIDGFWKKFGKPVDHRMSWGPNRNMVYSCNGHTKLLSWRLEWIERGNFNANLFRASTGVNGSENIVDKNSSICSSNLLMGQLGAKIDEESRKLAQTGAEVFLYSGPLLADKNGGEVHFKVEKNGGKGEKDLGYMAKPEHFFKVRLWKVAQAGKLHLKAYIFPGTGWGSVEQYETNLEEVQRISGIQMLTNNEALLRESLDRNWQPAKGQKKTWLRHERTKVGWR